MEKVNKKILKTVKLTKSSVSIKKKKSVTVKLSGSLNKANVKSISYTTTKKAIATVTKKGVVKAKKAGNAIIKAKVVLKNGATKTLNMKIKVKK